MKETLLSLFLAIPFNLGLFAQSSTKSLMDSGRKVYQKNCLACHQADGGGVPKMNPPLIDASFVTGDKIKLVQWVLLGSTEKVPIDGKYYSNNMPAQAGLKDQEIAEVLTYIRNNFHNKASTITATEVKKIRATTPIAK
ncbi:MAG: c-type cytochrome [Ginsengibacter sp.]